MNQHTHAQTDLVSEYLNSPPRALSERLKTLRSENREQSLTVGEMINVIGKGGFGVLFLLLSMPSALPLPAAGYSTPFGVAIAILGLQMILGRRTPWIPSRFEKFKLKQEFSEKMLNFTIRFMEKFEHWIRPRFSFLCKGYWAIFMGSLIVIMACLMILPIPLTNTVPAMMVFFMALGLTENDGCCCLLACGFASCAVILYTFIIYMVYTYGLTWIINLKEIIFMKLGLN